MTDLEGRAFRRVGGTLVAVDFAAQEMLGSIPEGKEVLITIRQPRSVQHHRWFFGCLRQVIANSDKWNDEEELLDVIKIATGMTKPVVLYDGTIYRRPRSISFSAMGQDAFQRFVKRALYVIGQMTGIDPEALMKEVDERQPPAQKKQKATSKQPVR
jgi:hypothetical protein